jgi:hypothetical protein
MNITNLDGEVVSWALTGYVSKGKIQNKSSYHLQARNLLISLHPTLQILEEVLIPIRKGQIAYLDFYLPLLKWCVEVHGEQHYKYVPYYHGNMMSFLKAQKKDREKSEWCNVNNIRYIELPYHEDIDQWTQRINHEQQII